MDTQTLINTCVAIIFALFGWLMRIFYDSLHQLQQSDLDLADKVNRIELLVTGEYVKKEDLLRLASDISSKLDRIYDRLDRRDGDLR